MNLVAWLASVAVAPLFLVVLYYLELAAISLWPRRLQNRASQMLQFAIVVPAHDEERLLGRTLASLAAITYAGPRPRILVVADNCTDGTASIAYAAGVECLVRDDPANAGKGQALAFAFERLLDDESIDSFVVVDADSVVDPHLLSALAERLSMGIEAVQVYHDVLAPERSASASLTWLGYSLSRILKYPARVRLGAGSNLVGNGMCFRRSLLLRTGWTAFSMTEDGEFQLQLYLQGVRVDFVREVKVWGAIPHGLSGWREQQRRWNVGKSTLRRRYVPLLMRRWLAGDRAALHHVLELLIPSFSLLALAIFGGACVSVFLELPLVVAWAWRLTAGGFTVYILLGLFLGRASWRVWRNLLLAPAFLAIRLSIALARRTGVESWVRSDRG